MENRIDRMAMCFISKVILESKPPTAKNLEVLGKINNCLAKDLTKLEPSL